MTAASKVCLISGAASGLGNATARRLLAQGYKVVVCDLPSSQGLAVAASLGPNAVFHPTDVTNAADVSAALDVAEAKLGPVFGTISCAGIGIAKRVG